MSGTQVTITTKDGSATADLEKVKDALDKATKIDIMPAGFAFPFSCYRTETLPMDELYTIINDEKHQADLEKLKPGFFKVEKYTGLIIASFAFPCKNEIEVLKKGIIAKLEVPQLESCRIVFLPGYILGSGKNSPLKLCLQLMNPYFNISGSSLRLVQEKLFELKEQAVVIKTIQYSNIPHSEIEKITLSGELETMDYTELPLAEAELNSLTGVYNTPYGIRSIKFSKAGKITILKSKKSSITSALVAWAIEQMI